jgi:hypothetical protein
MVSITASTGSPSARIQITRREYLSAPVTFNPTRTASQSVSEESEALPTADYEEVFRIRGELPHGYWLYYGLPVRVRIESGEYVAIQPGLALFAFGESPMDAILNLREELVEHYERLLELGERVGPQLARQRLVMHKLLSPPDA